ncbi:MAG: hypothetical protein U1E59_18555 [Amaricoccus sp.]
MSRTAPFAAGLIAALAATGAAAQDTEMSCIEALSAQLGVAMAEVDVKNTRDTPGEGSEVHATVNHAPYTCRVNDAGRVLSVERGNG